MTPAEQIAALDRWIAEHPAPVQPWNHVAEARMAHLANGGTLRDVPDVTVASRRGGRDVVDEVGFVRRNGNWTWEPYAGEVSA